MLSPEGLLAVPSRSVTRNTPPGLWYSHGLTSLRLIVGAAAEVALYGGRVGGAGLVAGEESAAAAGAGGGVR